MICYEGKAGKERKKEERMKKAQPPVGIKPATSLSQGECSTAALRPPPFEFDLTGQAGFMSIFGNNRELDLILIMTFIAH